MLDAVGIEKVEIFSTEQIAISKDAKILDCHQDGRIGATLGMDTTDGYAQGGLPVPMPQENNASALASELSRQARRIRHAAAGPLDRSSNGRAVRGLRRAHGANASGGEGLSAFQPNLRGIGWWKNTLPLLESHLPEHLFLELAKEVVVQDSFFRDPVFEALPAGPVHADLFRDNVLWAGARDPSTSAE